MNHSNSGSDTTAASKQCSFCKRKQHEVEMLIQTPDNFICSECVEAMGEAVQTQRTLAQKRKKSNRPAVVATPKEILTALNEEVVGQQRAKKAISVTIYNHYNRIKNLPASNSTDENRINQLFNDHIHGASAQTTDGIEIEKSNALFIGRTGTGKTLIAKKAAKAAIKGGIPFVIVDVTTLTEAGYVGEDVESIIQRLYQAANYDVEKTQWGIIYLDEIDKLSRRSDNPSITRDVSGEGVQQALLKLLEGTIAAVPLQGSRKHPHQETVLIDTTNILFICGGAFDGLEKIVRERIERSSIGFSAEIQSKTNKKSLENLAQHIETEDLVKYGLIPELIGRLPIITSLEDLSEDQLVQVLIEPKNALAKQYIQLFKFNNVELEFEQEALVAIAQKAITRKTGARGLRTILENHLLDLMYEIPSRTDIAKALITKDCIVNQADPILSYRETSSIEDKEIAVNE
jgi:ATP-dependent Clp protease ATP-binding subunit ClpX